MRIAFLWVVWYSFPLIDSADEPFPGWIPWAKTRYDTSSFPYLILIYSNEGYMDVLVNQLVAMMRFDERLPLEVGVVCTDAAAAKTLESFGAPPCYELNAAHLDNAQLWVTRVLMVAQCIENDISVLLTDSDAVWQHDPRSDLMPLLVPSATEDSSATEESSSWLVDVAGQRGSFPKTVDEVWGATLCMGFVAFRATTTTKMLMKVLEKEILHIKDDQIAINTVLQAEEYFNVTFKNRLTYANSDTMDYGTGRYEGHDIKIALLPEARYTRISCNKRNTDHILTDSVIAHCLTAKTGESKMAAFAKYDCLYINSTKYRATLIKDDSNVLSFTDRLTALAEYPASLVNYMI